MSNQSHRPAFLTGTSTEFLGRRPLPRVVRCRTIAVILGPPSSGKSLVAGRLVGDRPLVLDAAALQRQVVKRVRGSSWDPAVLEVEGLVLDGPQHLRSRGSALRLLKELLLERSRAGRRTAVVSQGDGSAQALVSAMPPGSSVTICLRFPKSKRARVRFARRLCSELGLPDEAVNGTARLQPWTYAAVSAHIRAWPHPEPCSDSAVVLLQK